MCRISVRTMGFVMLWINLPGPTYYFKNSVDVKPAPFKLPEGTKFIWSYSDVSDSSGPYRL